MKGMFLLLSLFFGRVIKNMIFAFQPIGKIMSLYLMISQNCGQIGSICGFRSKDNYAANFILIKFQNFCLNNQFHAYFVEVGTGTIMMRKTAYLMLKSASKILHALTIVPQRTAGIQTILENRQYSYLLPTPFTLDRLEVCNICKQYNLIQRQLHYKSTHLFGQFLARLF